MLIAVWALQWQLDGTDYPWFLYALAGWGVGLAIHYVVVRDMLGPDRPSGTPSDDQDPQSSIQVVKTAPDRR
jgi:hypothetical protein